MLSDNPRVIAHTAVIIFAGEAFPSRGPATLSRAGSRANKQGMIPLVVGLALSVCPQNPMRLNFLVPIIDSMGLSSGVITVPEFPSPYYR